MLHDPLDRNYLVLIALGLAVSMIPDAFSQTFTAFLFMGPALIWTYCSSQALDVEFAPPSREEVS